MIGRWSSCRRIERRSSSTPVNVASVRRTASRSGRGRSMAGPANDGRRAGSGSNRPAAHRVRPNGRSGMPSPRLRWWNQSSCGLHWRRSNAVSSSPGVPTSSVAQVRSDRIRVASGVDPASLPARGTRYAANPVTTAGSCTRTAHQERGDSMSRSAPLRWMTAKRDSTRSPAGSPVGGSGGGRYGSIVYAGRSWTTVMCSQPPVRS